jgi:Cu+-exporting ATPase
MSSENVILPITGMSCANCALNIERNLKKLQGVEETNVMELPLLRLSCL